MILTKAQGLSLGIILITSLALIIVISVVLLFSGSLAI